MFQSNTDREWKKFGKQNPYFGVLAEQKFQQSSLSPEAKQEFFQSGSNEIDRVVQNIRKYIDPNFKISQALDFGCGVGRLIIPLSQIANSVTGVDVSEAMLKEAQTNCDAQNINNVRFIQSDDCLTLLDGKYNLIYSYIVFQHIPVKRGTIIFSQLLTHLSDGGIGVVHFTYAKESQLQTLNQLIKDRVPLAENTINLVKGRGFFAPQMRMHTYDLNKIFSILQKSQVEKVHHEFTNHGGHLGVVLYFKKYV